MTRNDPDPDGLPSTAEIAALTARLRDLSHRGGTDAERAAFLADKDALLARIPDDARPADESPPSAGYVDVAMPPEMVEGIEGRRTAPARPDDSAELIARLADLRTRATRAAVSDYLRDASEQVGTDVSEWGLDQGDVDAIAAVHRLPTGATITAGQDADEEDARAAQLARWHADDHASDADEVVHGHGMGWTQ